MADGRPRAGGGIAASWNRLPTGGKAAVLVGGAAIGFLAVRWYKNRKSGSSAAGTTLQVAGPPSPWDPGTGAGFGGGGGFGLPLSGQGTGGGGSTGDTSTTPPASTPAQSTPAIAGAAFPATFVAAPSAGYGGGDVVNTEGIASNAGGSYYYGQTAASTSPGTTVGGVSVPAGAEPYYQGSQQIGYQVNNPNPSISSISYPLHPVEYST